MQKVLSFLAVLFLLCGSAFAQTQPPSTEASEARFFLQASQKAETSVMTQQQNPISCQVNTAEWFFASVASPTASQIAAASSMRDCMAHAGTLMVEGHVWLTEAYDDFSLNQFKTVKWDTANALDKFADAKSEYLAAQTHAAELMRLIFP